MVSHFFRQAACLASVLALISLATARAQEPSDKSLREIFVPFEDLNVLLESETQRVFLTRQEYDALVAKARTKPLAVVPHQLALVAADYQTKLEEGRALLTGNLSIEVFGEGLFALPLELAGVGIRTAMLDGQPAPLIRNDQQWPAVLVQGKGMHQLVLSLTAPLQTAAAQQSLHVTLPTTTAARLRLAVPGNVEVKGGAAVIDRQFDMAANLTRLELVPQRGGMSIVLSLNNRLLRDQRVVVARSVLVAEVTLGYERIHATVSHRVLHGAIDKLRFAIPTGFEVTTVESPLLARWEEQTEGDQKILEATLREPTTEQVVLNISANRAPAAGEDWLAALAAWKFPRLVPLDVAGQVAVVGLLLEDRLQPENLAATGLLPIDASVLVAAIPASVFAAEPGAPTIRQVATYYAPAADYELSAKFTRPPAGLNVASNSLLVIGDRGLTLTGGIALTPTAESLFDVRLIVPPGWQVTQVTGAEAVPLVIERYPIPTGTRIVVRLKQAIPVGQSATINIDAASTPTAWLTDWTAQTLEFPRFVVESATTDSGAIAVQTLDDLKVRPDTLAGLIPLVETEKAAFGLAELPTTLAYRYGARNFAASLAVERTKPSLKAEVFSFFKIEPDQLTAHYQLNYDVREARTRLVRFRLPQSTPQEISIRGLGGTVVKEFRPTDDGAWRQWEVQLAERQMGRVQLAVEFQQPYSDQALARDGLPLAQATDVEYQSAYVAIEGDEELDISFTTSARQIDVGELAGAEYAVGRRVIGAFGFVGDQASVQVNIARRQPYALPPALVQRASLTTKVSEAGRSQSLAEYDLLTKATLLEIRLPSESTLWSINVGDQPTKPQREGESLLLSLPAQAELAMRQLKIVYETAGAPLGLSGQIEIAAPTLLVRAVGDDAQREIPQADLEWTLHLPTGYSLRRSGGTVYTDVIQPRQPAAAKVAGFLYWLAGGIRSPSQTYSATTTYSANQVTMSAGPSATTSEPAPAGADAMDDAPAEAAAPPPSLAPPAMDALRDELREELSLDVQQRQAVIGELESRAEQAASRKDVLGLSGVSTLGIDLQRDYGGQSAIFRSLGADPVLRAAVIDNRRVHAAAWGLALLVALVGVGLTFQSARRQASYAIVVLLASSLPLFVTDRLDEVAQVLDYIFYAGCILAVYFPLAAIAIRLGRRLVCKLPRELLAARSAQTAARLVVALALGLAATSALAQQPEPAGVRIVNLKDLLPLLDDDQTPVTVPADALIVPYDPDKLGQPVEGEKLLVPYERYIELWNRANPDKQLAAALPPADYALAGARYEAALTAGDSLQLRGTIEIDVFTDKPVAVPLHLAGGVLVKATVDGQPARLQLVEPESAQQAKPQTQIAEAAAHIPPRLLLLHLTGQGRKKLELTIQMGLARQGGWRLVRGQVPVGPAAALALTAAAAGTEIRQVGLPDRANFETTTDGETIETALLPSGAIDLQWRAKVAEGQVDQSLTAQSAAVFDVREDSLRLVWQVRLEYGRTARDSFTFAVPADYLVEQVSGENLRGWQAKTVGPEQLIDVTLLKPAQGTVTLTLQLARRGRVGQGELAEFTVPSVLVIDAALQQGEIAVRRSPRLELRTLAATGLSRAETAENTAPIEQLADATDAPVLVARAYQMFRFVRPPFSLRLAASQLSAATTAEVRAALRVAERETTLDAAVIFRPQGEPLFKVELLLPQGFELDRLGPADLEWTVTTEDDRKKLTVHLLAGRTSEFTLTLFGRIVGVGDPPAADGEPRPRTLPAPVIEVLHVQKQAGDLVVLPDPDTDVRLENLQNADSVLLMQAIDWLAAEQQPLAKAALRFRSPDYGASLVLTPRTPQVSVRTVTNVKVTPRAVEETILLNFQIEQAGIRKLSFLLPERLAEARLNVKLLKSKTVEPATAADGQPLAGWVRFTLELQDYVRDQFGVIVMHDRLLTATEQEVAIPRVETGRTDQRLVAIENAGRDEVVIAEANLVGLELLSPQQQAWRELTALLGSNVTQAYVVTAGAANPRLSFQTKERARAETAAARIDLATTLLVLDAAGTYRALQEYRVTNATEQFLDVELPAGARLWTATVAGQPVKPLIPPPAAGESGPPPGVVRIPLVKLGEGAGDYPVQLKYGGQIPAIASFSQIRVPLMQTININVELSQVTLFLPESHVWFDFRGTMRKVSDEGELAGVVQSYLNKRIQEASQLLSSANPYTQMRAKWNLKQSRLMVDDSRSMSSSNSLGQLGRELQTQNEALLDLADEQAGQQQAAEQAQRFDNRERLNNYWAEQDVERSKNVVSGLASNFDGAALGKAEAAQGESAFNPSFLDQNALGTQPDQAAGGKKPAAGSPAPGGSEAKGDRFYRGGKDRDALPAQQTGVNGQAQAEQKLQLFNEQQQQSLEAQFDKKGDVQQPGESSGRKQEIENLSRYRDRLAQNAQGQSLFGKAGQPAQSPALPQSPGGEAGYGSAQAGDGGMGRGQGVQPGDPGADPFSASPNGPARPAVVATSDGYGQLTAGLASLDFELPQRGQVYSFTTPRGEIEITARPLAQTLVGRLAGLGGVAIAIFLLWLVARPGPRKVWRRLAQTVTLGVLLALVGLASVIAGIFPVAGLALVVVGIALAVRNRFVAPVGARAA
ncbi:MAG: hypothetical protein WD872_10035 [Pirellulaceae bacterium]